MLSRNACKTCALGMGGQNGGMVNESGHFPEVCKKSLQAQVADMHGAIDPDYFASHDLEYLANLTPKQAEDLGRLACPLVLEPGARHFKPLSYEHALSYLGVKLKDCLPERVAFYASGRSSNEAAFVLQSFGRVFGTNNIMNCSFYCHQASGVALKMAVGSGTATVDLKDLELCDLLILIGANPASNHPRLMTQLANLRGRGGKVIVINPLIERPLERFHVPSQPLSLLFGADIASTYIQPLAGGDAALLVGVLKVLIDEGKVKKDFVEAHTEGWEQVFAYAASQDFGHLERISGVARGQIIDLARQIADAKGVVFAWAMGLTHHQAGVDNILAVSNLALATANVGRPGAGLLPIRGHSNVQGVGSVGVSPAIQDALRQSMELAYGKELSTAPGLDTYAMIEAADKEEIDFLLCLGGNLWGSNPDSTWASSAMQKVDTTVYLSTKLNPGHFHGRGKSTFILPVLARDEEPQSTTQESMFNFVRYSDGGEHNVSGTIYSEIDILVDLAVAVLGDTPFEWSALKSRDKIRKLIADTVPGFSEIAQMDKSKREFEIPGRVMHVPNFPTDSGRARMHNITLKEFEGDALRLITLRSEGQFNTVVYEEHDLYRGVPHRHCILLSAEDGERLKLKDGQRVLVRGEAGYLENIEVVFGRIRAGVAAMYYPEANVLIKANIDPRSKTPAFKSAPVWIEAN